MRANRQGGIEVSAIPDRCFACDHKLGKYPAIADTRDSQYVLVGTECYKLIVSAGEQGYKPPKGGPRLYRLPRGLSQAELSRVNRLARGL